MTEPEPRLRRRYDELSVASRLYRDPNDPALRRNPFQQLWRQHMLAQAITLNGLYDLGRFIVIAPALNSEVQRAAARYERMLAGGENLVGFENISLEAVIASLSGCGAPAHAQAVADRYTDFTPVHELI
jgi:hypothetical protein